MHKDYMIGCLHLLYRGDRWINELFKSIGLASETADKRLDVVYNNMFFAALNEYGCEVFEKDLGIVPLYGSSIEQRRKLIQSKWLAKSFCSLPALQSIADAHFGKGVTVKYDGDATLHYVGNIGFNDFDTDVSSFLKDIDEIKPAHFDYDWTYRHNIWRNYYNPKNWGYLAKEKWQDEEATVWRDHTVAIYKKTWSYCQGRTWKEMMYKEVS